MESTSSKESIVYLVAEMVKHEDLSVPIIKCVSDNINIASRILVGINIIQLNTIIEELNNGIHSEFNQNMSIIKLNKDSLVDTFNSEHVSVTEDLIESKELLATLFETNFKYETAKEKYFNTRIELAKSNVMNLTGNDKLSVSPLLYISDRKRNEAERISKMNVKPVIKK